MVLVLQQEGKNSFALPWEAVSKSFLVPGVTIERSGTHQANQHEREEERRSRQGHQKCILSAQVCEDGQRIERGKREGEPLEPFAEVIGKADILKEPTSGNGVLSRRVTLAYLRGRRFGGGLMRSTKVHEFLIVVYVACESNGPCDNAEIPQWTLPYGR